MANPLKKVRRRLIRIFKKPVNRPVCYCVNKEEISYLPTQLGEVQKAINLPSELIFQPGLYVWQQKTYDLTKEGLYRFIIPEKINCQRIIYKNDVATLLSSISWMASHGHYDDVKSDRQLIEIAKKNKIYITCERMSQFGHSILKSLGIESRVVYTEERAFSDSYDCGHVMLEVFVTQQKKWILYDLDMGVAFFKNNEPLSFLEFIKEVSTGNYDIHALTQKSILDVSRFQSRFGFKYHFLMEGVMMNLKKWYRKVCQVAIIFEQDKRYYYQDNPKHEHASNIVLNVEEFGLKFYVAK